jgi:putative ATP-dependent endonuclease of OLD family
MHISELRIRNFRNFLCARFRFEKGVNTLIGENGSGKTNAFYALRLLLDDTLARNAGQMRENDFCRALIDWRGHWIVIAADFAELDASEGCQLLRHSAAHMDGSQTGTCTLIFRPKRPIRAKLFAMNHQDEPKEAIAAFLKSLTIDDYEAVITGRGKGDFLNDDAYKSMIGDVNDLSFPDPDIDDQEKLGVRIHGIDSEVTCTFAQALRDVVSDLRGYRSNPLLALLRGTESTIKFDDAESITSAVASLNLQISSLAEVRRIATGVGR